MALVDYFQTTKRPVCRKKLQVKALGSPKIFKNQVEPTKRYGFEYLQRIRKVFGKK